MIPATAADTAGLARASDPETSHAAAVGIIPHLSRIQERVLSIFNDLDPMSITDQVLLSQYRDRFGACAESTPRKRRKELVDLGIIECSGEHRNHEHSRAERFWKLKP